MANLNYIIISDEINGNLFLLEEAETIRGTTRDRRKLAERTRPRRIATTSLVD